jgi:energy-coupling factor transporter ATP-binding protein EcfA2
MSQVSVTELYFAYPPTLPGEQSDWTLRGVDLQAGRGEFLSVMGPTDAGKSTLALALVGIVPQSTGGRIRGAVRVAGLNARQHPVAELARHASLVFQDPEMQFFNLSVETEVAFGLEVWVCRGPRCPADCLGLQLGQAGGTGGPLPWPCPVGETAVAWRGAGHATQRAGPG